MNAIKLYEKMTEPLFVALIVTFILLWLFFRFGKDIIATVLIWLYDLFIRRGRAGL